jgi:Spy/CpxP family protein refolding chaperone
MKNSLFIITILCVGNLAFTLPTFAAKGNSDWSPAQIEANYTKAIEGRTASILKALALTDTNQVARVHDIIMAQWRALNAWHNENDAKLKAAKADTNAVVQIQESLKELHRKFIAALSQYLTPAQIETVKDKMTYGVVEVTYRAYLEIVPNLTDAEKAKILELLKEGREEAMDGGSSHEKAVIMKRYKGKINLYLTRNGHDVAKAYKDWGARQKARAAAAATNSVPAP